MNLFAETYQMSSEAVFVRSAAVDLFIALIFLVFMLGVYAIGSYITSQLFKKAGVDQWRAWVPVYNNWIMYRLGGQAGWWAVLALIPIVNIASAIMLYIAMHRIGLDFGKQDLFVLWAIFLPLVWILWLAFDGSKWSGRQLPNQKSPLK